MKFVERKIFQHESGKEILTFLFVESTFLDQKIQAVFRIREAEEVKDGKTEEVFDLDVIEPPAYFAWAAERQLGTKGCVWTDISGASMAREIQAIPLDAATEAFVKTRRDLLDSAERSMTEGLGIPNRFLEGRRG